MASPDDWTISALLPGFHYVDSAFNKTRGVVTFDRVEDFNSGWEWFAELGPSLEAWGATQDGLVGRGRVNKGWRPFPGQLFVLDFDYEGRFEHGKIKEGITDLDTRYSWWQWRPHNTAFVRFKGVLGKNLEEETQFLLGGENGLRGYSVRQFEGSSKVLLIMENRRNFIYDYLQLIHIGGAVFFDTGATWRENDRPSVGDFHSDVGLGLRLASSRSVESAIGRIDLAYALDDNKKSSRWVVSIGVDFALDFQDGTKFDQ